MEMEMDINKKKGEGPMKERFCGKERKGKERMREKKERK